MKTFRERLNQSIDNELIRHINQTSKNLHSSNIDNLLSVSSQAIIQLLKQSPTELKNLLKLFLNR